MVRNDEPIDPKQLSRNLNELLQELRVIQPGVQILSAFLLTVPFSARFGDLTQHQTNTYLWVLSGSLVTVALLMAPVAFHRILFRKAKRRWIVEATNVCTLAGLGTLGLTLAGAAYLVFDVVASPTAARIALAVSLVVLVVLWVLLPAVVGRRYGRER